MKNKALDIVYNTHNATKEKALFLHDFIQKQHSLEHFENIQETMEFFYKHIPLHFAYEEAVMRALVKCGKLSKDEAVCIERITLEHDDLRKDFDNLKEMSAALSRGCTKEQRELFLNHVNNMVEALSKHAEFEDQYLYPLADNKADEELLSAVEKEIARIVY